MGTRPKLQKCTQFIKSTYIKQIANKLTPNKPIKMPKQKTRKSISKRFKLTKTGKILRRTIGMRHLKANKSKKNSRRQKQVNYVIGKVAKKMKKFL